MSKISFDEFKKKVSENKSYTLEPKSIGFITISEIVNNVVNGCIYTKDSVPIVNYLHKEAWLLINVFSLIYEIDLDCIYVDKNTVDAPKFIEVFNFLNKTFCNSIGFSILNWKQLNDILDKQIEMEIKKKTSIEYNLMQKIDEIFEIVKNTDIKGLLQLTNELPPEVVGNVVSLFSKKKSTRKKKEPKQVPEKV